MESANGPASYGPDWSVGACEIEGCRYCTDGWTGTCQRCGGRKTHQPMWSHEPDGWQVDVCPTCGYAIEQTWNGGFVEQAYYVAPPDPTDPTKFHSEINWPDNLAMRILKGQDIVEDHPRQFCAVQSCRQSYDRILRTDCPESAVDTIRRHGISVTGGDQGRWDAQVPLCAHHP